jgi:nitrogen fixation NifU-like protein
VFFKLKEIMEQHFENIARIMVQEQGKTIDEALKISNAAVAEALGGLPKVKMHCSVLAEEALKSALDDYYKKKGLVSPVKMPAESGHEHEME